MKNNMKLINTDAIGTLYIQIKENPDKVILKTQSFAAFNNLKKSYENKCLLQGRQKDGAFTDANLFSTYVLQLTGENVLATVLDLLKSDTYNFYISDYIELIKFANSAIENKKAQLMSA